MKFRQNVVIGSYLTGTCYWMNWTKEPNENEILLTCIPCEMREQCCIMIKSRKGLTIHNCCSFSSFLSLNPENEGREKKRNIREERKGWKLPLVGVGEQHKHGQSP
jgi:hypothetical protein